MIMNGRCIQHGPFMELSECGIQRHLRETVRSEVLNPLDASDKR